MSLLRIGDKVQWKTGRVESVGVVLDDEKEGDEKVKVFTHLIGGIRSHRELDVDRSLIELYNK